jgi:uncharacterized membrane protein
MAQENRTERPNLQDRLIQSESFTRKRESEGVERQKPLKKFDNEERMLQMVDQEDELMKLYDEVPLFPQNFYLPPNSEGRSKENQDKKAERLNFRDKTCRNRV